MTPLETVTAALEARGHTVRNGACRCPAHDDKTPSLSVGEGRDGAVVVKCHAGCTGQAIVDALGLTFKDLFPPREDATVVVARYPYQDADGHTVVTVVRTHPKGFYREPKGVTETPLYNLPNVLKAIADGNDIWIVEGEKDVHTLARHGETATCNIGGAGKFTYAHAEQLRGAHTIYIVADADEPGRAHARHVAELLPHDGVTLWQPQTGKDITDHFNAGHTIHDLQPLDETNVTETEQPPNDGPINWDNLWAEDFPDEEWVIEPLIPKGRGVSLYAPAKEGKSTILLAAAAAAATGRSVFGLPPQPARRCMYGDYEMTRADLKARLTELGYGPADDLSNLFYYLIPPWAPLDTVEGGVMITAAALTHNAEVVFIDTIGRAVAGEEDKSDTMRAFYRCTGQTLKREGIAWLRADHSGKDLDRGARGTSAKNDDVDIQWFLKRGDDSITITRTHTRIAWAPEKIVLEKKENDDGVVTYEMTGGKGYVAGTKDLAAQLDELDVPATASVRTCRTALKTAGIGARGALLQDAVRFRRGVYPGVSDFVSQMGYTDKPTGYDPSHQRDTPRDTADTPFRANGGPDSEAPRVAPRGAVASDPTTPVKPQHSDQEDLF